jgi:signal transduction histidine kinase
VETQPARPLRHHRSLTWPARRQALLSRRAIATQEDERARVARELHDDLGQLLTGLRLELDFIRRGHPDIAASFTTATSIVDSAVASLRHLCRGLRPPLLDDLGLEASARQLVAELGKRVEYRVELTADIDEERGPLPREVTLCAYRVLQEALTNVSRHAHAHTVRVEVGRQGDDLRLAVSDDGLGFAIEDLPATSGLGITGMSERAALVGGHLDVASTRLGGTTVTLLVPLPPVARAEAS